MIVLWYATITVKIHGTTTYNLQLVVKDHELQKPVTPVLL